MPEPTNGKGARERKIRRRALVCNLSDDAVRRCYREAGTATGDADRVTAASRMAAFHPPDRGTRRMASRPRRTGVTDTCRRITPSRGRHDSASADSALPPHRRVARRARQHRPEKNKKSGYSTR